MDKKIDEWWKLIVFIVCVSIFSTIALNFILSLDISDKIKIADGVWVGFWGCLIGSIIGGCITFIGIKITIDHNKESEKQNKRFSVAPFLSLDINSVDKDEIKYEKFKVIGSTDFEKLYFKNINYPYVTLDLSVVNNHIVKMHTAHNVCERFERDIEPSIHMITIENNGLNNAVYMYIDDIVFTDEGEDKLIDRTDLEVKSSFKDNCICTGLRVGDKFGIALSIMHNSCNDKIIYLTIRYNDLIGNTYRQKIKIKMLYYGSYLNDNKEIWDGKMQIDTINYSDGITIKVM